MTRPTPESAYPYTRGDMSRITGASVPQVKKLSKAVLKKRARGTGNFMGFNMDDAVRIGVARELLRVGVQAGAIHSLFASLETPKIATAKPWSWLRSVQARVEGAALVLLLAPPLAPAQTGAVYLTTAVEAVEWLKSKRTVIVIDVGAIIGQIEQHTGATYGQPPSVPLS